jgi:glycosyltransferase involved in cell wall biosynthesis
LTEDARSNRRLAILFHEPEMLGAGVSVLRVLDGLKDLGWTAGGWFPGPGPLVNETAGHLEVQAYREKPIAVSIGGWRRRPGALRRLRATPGYLSAVRDWLICVRPNVVHANSLAMLPEAAVARTLGLPIVVQVHELPAPGRKRDLTLRGAGLIADVLVGVSSPVTRMLQERAGRTPVVTVHNGVPVLRIEREEPTAFVVGCLGHVSRTKGTDLFLEAAELALRSRPELRFEHVGPIGIWGDDEFDRRIVEMAASPALTGRLTMLGWRPAAEALARWRILVLPSRQEAFPLITLEAMAAGVPVVATRVGGVSEQIVHLESGIFVPPEDPAALADWIVRLHDDDELRARLIREAAKRVKTHFTLASQAEGLNRAYRLAAGWDAESRNAPAKAS